MEPKEKLPNFISTSKARRLGFFSSALLGRDSGEDGPELDVMTTTGRAGGLPFLAVDEGQDPRESFLAGAAEEFVVR
ncbi:MAG: hypothetical protein ABR915_24390, partial [Thermoguttaceae bacterium]